MVRSGGNVLADHSRELLDKLAEEATHWGRKPRRKSCKMREPVNSRCQQSAHISLTWHEQISLTAKLNVNRNSNQRSKVSLSVKIIFDIDSFLLRLMWLELVLLLLMLLLLGKNKIIPPPWRVFFKQTNSSWCWRHLAGERKRRREK